MPNASRPTTCNRAGHCVVGGVGQADVPLLDAEGGRDFATSAGEFDDRPAAGLLMHFDFAQRDALRESGPQRFHDGFLAGEANGVMLSDPPRSCAAAESLSRREDSPDEVLAVVFDHVRDAADLHKVDSVAEDLAHRGFIVLKISTSPQH